MKILYFPLSDPGTWLSLPDSALLKTANPFFVPDFDSSFSAHPVIAGRIDRLGKSVAARFASRYINEFAAGFVITADNLLAGCRAEGRPWTPATGFDRSVIIGPFHPFADKYPLRLRISEVPIGTLSADTESADPGITGETPCFDIFARALEASSAYNTMKTGDIILIPVDTNPVTLQQNTILSAIDPESGKTLSSVKIK